MSIRAKRVSDPLDDKVKARLRGEVGHHYASSSSSGSGSEHEAVDPFFSGPIHAFLDMDDAAPLPSDYVQLDEDDDVVDNGGDSDGYGSAEAMCRLLDYPSRGSDTNFLGRLRSDVEALGGLLLQGSTSRSAYRRAAMARLRESGYNAGICKARWESSGSLTAGSYEYIDVVVDDDEEEEEKGIRYIVDVEFGTEFQVARPTEEYAKLAAALPRAMVGRGEEVKKVVRVMAEAAKRSMKSKGMEVPPWRKRRYMLAKWLGPYRRTINPLPASSAAAAMGGEMIKFRAVGFGNAVGRVIPQPTR